MNEYIYIINFIQSRTDSVDMWTLNF